MLSLFLLAATPLVAHAYQQQQQQQQQQTPLIDHAPKFVVPLQLDNQRNYYFQSTSKDIRHLDLEALEDIVSYGETDFRPHAISIHIPLDPTADGTMSLIPITPELFQSTSQMNWIDTQTPGDDMPVSHIGVRKGGAISEEIYTVRLALETPYISIPSDIYDIVALATNPVVDPDSNGLDNLVDCSEMGRFPDLFVGLDPEKEPNMFEEITEVDDREIVITPSQYIMETKPGRCVLLVKKNPEQDSEEAVLGWAAIRGKHVVLDWVNERTGFEI